MLSKQSRKMRIWHEVAADDHVPRGLAVGGEKCVGLSDRSNPGKTHEGLDVIERLGGSEGLGKDTRMRRDAHVRHERCPCQTEDVGIGCPFVEEVKSGLMTWVGPI